MSKNNLKNQKINNLLDNNKISKDLLKSIFTHGFIIFSIIIFGFIENRKIFYKVKTRPSFIKQDNQTLNITKNIVQATLVDHQSVQQAIKRQEMQAADKFMREKKLQQQEQQLAQLTKMAEQEMLKVKQEAQKAKQDRDKLKKEQETLQQTATKLNNQAKELSAQKEKLEKLQQQHAEKKKIEQRELKAAQLATQTSQALINQKEIKGIQGSQSHSMQSQAFMESEAKIYEEKWRILIVNNRKKTMFFPENLECSFRIKLLPNGNLSFVKIEKSSGNTAYDYFSEQAIYKSVPFDMPEDPVLNKELIQKEYLFNFDDRDFNND